MRLIACRPNPRWFTRGATEAALEVVITLRVMDAVTLGVTTIQSAIAPQLHSRHRRGNGRGAYFS